MTRPSYVMIDNPSAYEAATRRNIIANAKKTYIRTYGDEAVQRVQYWLEGAGIADYKNGNPVYKEGFAGSLCEALHKYGKLTEKQHQAVLNILDKNEARKLEWADKEAALNASRTWLGEVGSKVTIDLTTRHIVEMVGMYGVSYLYICEDQDKNVVIYKGTSQYFPVKGERATVIATVKEHGVREGVKQTVIQRPKVV